MKKRDLYLGVFLVLIGVLFLLTKFRVLDFNLSLLFISIYLLFYYVRQDGILYLAGGIVLMGFSIMRILNYNIFPNTDIRLFLVLALLGIGLFIVYKKSRNNIFFFLSLLSVSFSINSLASNLFVGQVKWLIFALLGLAFYIYYFLVYRASNIVWPKNIAVGLLIVSFFVFILSKVVDNINLFTIINYLWPVALIALGANIIYNIFKR